jgi:hypothetical protein
VTIQQIKKALTYLFKAQMTPNLMGIKGVGKTETIKQYAKENGYRLVVLHLGEMNDPGDLLGLTDFMVDDEGNKFSVFHKHKWWPKNKDEKVIIFLDEINRTTPLLTQAVFSLTGAWALNGDYLNPETQHVVAAQNPPTSDYVVADMSDDAWNDRMCYLKFEPSVGEWTEHMISTGSATSQELAFFQDNPAMLDGEYQSVKMDFIKPSRRSVKKLLQISKMNPESDIFQEIAIGTMGITAGTAYLKYLEDMVRTVNAIDVLDSYSKVKGKVKIFADTSNPRVDALKVTTDQLLIELDKYSETNLLSEQQLSNVKEFIMDLPMSLGFAFTRQLLNHVATQEALGSDESLVNYFTANKNELDKIIEEEKVQGA